MQYYARKNLYQDKGSHINKIDHIWLVIVVVFQVFKVAKKCGAFMSFIFALGYNTNQIRKIP